MEQTKNQLATESATYELASSPNDVLSRAHGHCEHWDHSRENGGGTNGVPGGLFFSMEAEPSETSVQVRKNDRLSATLNFLNLLQP